MSPGDAIIAAVIILCIWFAVNQINQTDKIIFSALNKTNTDPSLQADLAHIETRHDGYVSTLAASATIFIFALITTIIITNMNTSLNPIAYGLFMAIMFLIYYLLGTILLPTLIPALQGTITTDVMPDWLTFLTDKWFWLVISVIVGSILGYARGRGA